MDRRAKVDRALWQQKMSLNTLMQTCFLWTESTNWHLFCLFLVLMWMFCFISAQREMHNSHFLSSVLLRCQTSRVWVTISSLFSPLMVRRCGGCTPRGTVALCARCYCEGKQPGLVLYCLCPPPAPLPPGLCFHRCCFSLLFVWRHQKLPTHDASGCLAKLAVSLSLAFCRIRRLVVHGGFRKMHCL